MLAEPSATSEAGDWMWRDAVKSRLLHERTQWLEDNNGDDVEIHSVTQLVQLLDVRVSRRTELDAYNIQCHDISPEPMNGRRRSLKRPRNDESNCAILSAVSFWSERLWVTGFLRHSQANTKQRKKTLCLCDATHQIPVHVVHPALELLDGLVLVKSWTIVQRRHADGEVSSMWMEVHGDPVLLHHPHGQQSFPLDEALAIVRNHYAMGDPPMYAGWKPWESLTNNSHQENPTAITASRGASKKRKIYVVLGRIARISPISVQEDSSSTHFFVEIEHAEAQDGSRSIVNILVSGSSSVRWHLFLWPGQLAMLTNLKKVYYSECEIFLLQTSAVDGAAEKNSNIFVWRIPTEMPRPQITSAGALMDPRCNFTIGSTVNFEGVVTSIVWDDCLVVESELPVLLTLFHYPWSDIKDYIRVGTRILVHHAHVLHRSSFTQRLRVGLCSRSHIRLAGHAPATSTVSTLRHGDQRRRLFKKWSLFGDFSRQSLAVSAWWLDLLEVLVQKFSFSTDSDTSSGRRGAAFACIRRREATFAIGQYLFSASPGQSVATRTLAQRFLTSHTEDDRDCPSVTTDSCSQEFLGTVVLTLGGIESLIRRLARVRITAAAVHDEGLVWPIQIDAKELSEVCAVGVLRGCDGASDLEIMDQTASIPVILDQGGTTSVSIDGGCSAYAFHKFGALVEVHEDKSLKSDDSRPSEVLVVSLRVSIGDVQRVTLCSNGHHERDNAGAKVYAVVVFVTHIGPWKRRRKMQTIVGDFRLVRGVGFRQLREHDSHLNWSSAHAIELLVNVDCESWFMQVHSWYKFDGVRENTSSITTATEATLVHHWLKMHAYSEASFLRDASEEVDQTPGSREQNLQMPIGQCESVSYIVDASSTVLPVGLPTSRPSLVEAKMSIPIDDFTQRYMTSMEELALKLRAVSQVHDLFVIDLPKEENEADRATSGRNRADPHTARLINLVGVVKERHLYVKHVTPANKPQDSLRESSRARGTKASQMCRLKIRDTCSLETVFITVDVDVFGAVSVLQVSTVVEISMIQCFIARASFKPFLTWTHCTTARRISDQVVADGYIFSQIPTTHLHALYKSSTIDRTIKRYVVQLAHLSYAVMKRRCSQCKQPLTLLKRQQAWVHAAALVEEGNASSQRPSSCPWKQLAQDAPLLQQKTFLSCSLRCIIDDGSAQAELFLENDIMWELLQCSRGQRLRFEDLLLRQTSELSFFATRSSVAALFTSPSMQENLYYQNEWRAFVQTTMAALGPVVVLAQRFYKPPPTTAAPPTAVLTFGKDIQITTPCVPLLQLEAVRIDALNARHELRRRLAAIQPGTRHTTEAKGSASKCH